MTRENLKALFANASVSTIHIETETKAVKHVCVGEDALESVEKKAKAALRRGAVVTWSDGRIQWLELRAVYDVTKTGSECYQWDESGNKVLCDEILTTKVGDKVESTTRRQKYVDYLKATNG